VHVFSEAAIEVVPVSPMLLPACSVVQRKTGGKLQLWQSNRFCIGRCSKLKFGATSQPHTGNALTPALRANRPSNVGYRLYQLLHESNQNQIKYGNRDMHAQARTVEIQLGQHRISLQPGCD
jgi:hypothetical protein